MKRSLCLLLAILICLALPVTVYAETYQISDTDLSIQFDNSIWYVFTRDNIENNPELEELGVSYEDMCNILNNNNAYMDSVLYYDDGDYIELFVRKTAQTSGMANLSNYSDGKVTELAAALAKRQNAEVYSVYQNQYKFIRLEYLDTSANLYLYEFITIVNKENYSFTFQSPSEFTDEKREEAENIIDSIQFEVDLTLKEKSNTSFWKNVITKTIGGAIAGGIAGGVIALISKKKAKKNSVSVDPTQEN